MSYHADKQTDTQTETGLYTHRRGYDRLTHATTVGVSKDINLVELFALLINTVIYRRCCIRALICYAPRYGSITHCIPFVSLVCLGLAYLDNGRR